MQGLCLLVEVRLKCHAELLPDRLESLDWRHVCAVVEGLVVQRPFRLDLLVDPLFDLLVRFLEELLLLSSDLFLL